MTDTHYSDGSTHDGAIDYGAPPVAPHFVAGHNCETEAIDPEGTFTFVTEHFKYTSTPPLAGHVPVTDDASIVVPYHAVAPGTVNVDVSAFVQGKAGFRADTWNIGTGVTAWVPFDCTTPKTTTTAPQTTTTMASSTSTLATTTTTTVAVPPPHELPRTGTPDAALGGAAIAMCALGIVCIRGSRLFRRA